MIDVLVIGGGGSALSSAISAKNLGASVMVVTKSRVTTSQTVMAQGGINAVLKDSDTTTAHIADTLKSAYELADKEMIEKLCVGAKESIEWLDELGVPFDRTLDSEVAQRRLGGTTFQRACYAQDYTGLKILHTLYDTALKLGVKFHEEYFLLNLIEQEGEVLGATFLDISLGEVKAIYASSVIIATGGYAGIYHNLTTNAYGSTGDGIASVIRAGGYISDMEFIQFHPTALKNSSILISESARGEGGYLLNSDGERFVDELLSRDIVARAIWQELDRGKEVFLDLRHIPKEQLEKHLPQELKLCRLENIEPTTQIIPIKPAPHYTMGGIDVDRNLKIKGLKRAFAVGECSNAKVHGANRLGGNSLLEIVSFGRLAGQKAYEEAKKSQIAKPKDEIQLQKDTAFINSLFYYPNRTSFYEKRELLGKIFYQNVGIVRKDGHMLSVLAMLRNLQRDFKTMGIGDKSKAFNTNLVEFIEFGNMLELGEIILVGAMSRKESRGAHYREDFPTPHPSFALHSIFWKEDGVLCADFVKGVKA